MKNRESTLFRERERVGLEQTESAPFNGARCVGIQPILVEIRTKRIRNRNFRLAGPRHKCEPTPMSRSGRTKFRPRIRFTRISTDIDWSRTKTATLSFLTVNVSPRFNRGHCIISRQKKAHENPTVENLRVAASQQRRWCLLTMRLVRDMDGSRAVFSETFLRLMKQVYNGNRNWTQRVEKRRCPLFPTSRLPT